MEPNTLASHSAPGSGSERTALPEESLRVSIADPRMSVEEGPARHRHPRAHLHETNGPVFKMSRDPRVTRVGRFRRTTSIDELPQLMNVLRGDMSLVGPRPPLTEEVVQYEPWQLKRLEVRPG